MVSDTDKMTEFVTATTEWFLFWDLFLLLCLGSSQRFFLTLSRSFSLWEPFLPVHLNYFFLMLLKSFYSGFWILMLLKNLFIDSWFISVVLTHVPEEVSIWVLAPHSGSPHTLKDVFESWWGLPQCFGICLYFWVSVLLSNSFTRG